ncbi:YesL family protein [Evansella cellulosilytica]|uniref:DUF624 domain-containing protein n=1 Tax=Evansella cellulosilytica (strain ATCC 21833 / DSM 2522 / FERM P-1141 / JCM 9156 / N-4) TaxID=649639 RepID=E6TRU6_EVAC2|nr:YesL family protein [Evansella cellulosilytica]ADU29469.1 protein of unknown function DUF624 [Evansella cellulosilytica DSM 2522]
MGRSWVDSPLYTIADWVMRLALINLLWLGFTVLGLFILGFMPATVAMFAVIRKLLMKEESVPIFKTFFVVFKKEFFKSNVLGLILFAFGYVLVINFMYLGTISGTIHTLLSFGLVFVGLFYLATIMIIFPIYVHLDLKFTQYFKQSLLVSFINPHIVIFMGAGIVGAYYVFNFIPGLTLFFFGSAIATFLMWSTLLAFNRIEKKKERLQAAQVGEG